MVCSVLLTGKYVRNMGFTYMSEITSTQLVHIIYSIFSCVVAWIIAGKIAGLISDQLFERLKMYGENAIFNITKGDKNKQQKLAMKEKHNKRVIIGNLILTIILNLVCGLIVNFIS